MEPTIRYARTSNGANIAYTVVGQSVKSYVYADRGETALKGFEDAVRLFEVRWRAEGSA